MKLFILLITLICCQVNFFIVNSHAEELAVVPIQTEDEVTGHIINIDVENSMISLKIYTNEEGDIYMTEDMYVLNDAVIEKDNKRIELQNLFPNDVVTVKYRISLDGRREIEHIWVKNE